MLNIIDFIKNIREKAGKTLISMGPNRDEFSYSDCKRPDFVKLEAAYRDFSVFASVNILSENVYGTGFKFIGENASAIKLCESVYNRTSFKPSIVDGIKDTLIYGIAYNEILWDGKDVFGLKIVDVKTIDPKWDEKANIDKYIQRTGMLNKKVTMEPEEIIFYRFFRSSDNIYGIGVIESIYFLLEIRRDIINSIKDIFKFLAMPPVHIVKEGARTKAELKKAEEKFKDFHRRSYFVTSEKYDIRLLEVKRTLPDLSKYLEQIDAYISIGLRVPSKILSGDVSVVTKASAVTLRQYARDEIGYVRNKLSWILEDQLFRPLCLKNNISDVPKLVWNPDISEDPKVKIEIQHKRIEIINSLIEKGMIDKEKVKELVDKIIEEI